MTKINSLGDLRTAIEDTLAVVMQESDSGVALNRDILVRLKSERKQLVELVSPQLIDLALTKILNDVCQKRSRREAQSGQVDLFGGYGRIPKRVVVGRGVKKETGQLTLSEAREWLESHKGRVVKDDNKDFAQLIAVCSDYSESGDETISELIERVNQAKQSDDD